MMRGTHIRPRHGHDRHWKTQEFIFVVCWCCCHHHISWKDGQWWWPSHYRATTMGILWSSIDGTMHRHIILRQFVGMGVRINSLFNTARWIWVLLILSRHHYPKYRLLPLPLQKEQDSNFARPIPGCYLYCRHHCDTTIHDRSLPHSNRYRTSLGIW